MRPFQRYPVLASLLKPFRCSQQLSMGLALAALIESCAARSMEIATLLAQWLSIRFDSALQRFYRVLHNSRINNDLLTRQLLSILSQKLGKKLLIAIDWTEWHDHLRMLVASVVSDRRAIPIHCAAFHNSQMPRSQNTRENTFLRVLAMVLREARLSATLLCDRGFRRASWLKLLIEHRFDFVVRLKADVHVLPPKAHSSRRLDRLGLTAGSLLDLGWVELRKDGAVRVRVIGVWQAGAREPWWLATNLADHPALVIAKYDRRMAIEEQFRDQKGCRFGVKLFWTQFKNPQALARFALFVGVAIFVWTAVGIAAAHRTPSLRFPHATKGPRQSFVTIGMRAIRFGCRGISFSAKGLARYLFRPRLRKFPWIQDHLAQK